MKDTELKLIKSARCISPRHPMKVCDLIADRLVEAFKKSDPESIAKISIKARRGLLRASGDVFSKGGVGQKELDAIVSEYLGSEIRTEWAVNVEDANREERDNWRRSADGIYYGFADRMTREMLPLEVVLARSLCETIYHYCEIHSEGKVWVTIDLSNPMKLVKAVDIKWAHATKEEILKAVEIWAKVYTINQTIESIDPYIEIISDEKADNWYNDEYLGYWSGSAEDVDFYGSTFVGRNGYEFKSPAGITPVLLERSGYLMARYLAVQILMSNPEADEVAAKLDYTNGECEPTVIINSSVVSDIDIKSIVKLDPKSISRKLKLARLNPSITMEFGQFGHNFRWEQK